MQPYVILKDIDQDLIDRWNNCFQDVGREFSHSMWFRTQEECNKKYSGWMSSNDKRRRIIQFYDEYGVVNKNFCLKNMYLWISLAFPDNEISKYESNIITKLEKSNWVKSRKGLWRKAGLVFSLERNNNIDEDIRENRDFPSNYEFLTIIVKSDGFLIPENVKNLQWKLFNQGLREQIKRGEPEYIKDLSVLKDYLPAQVELGCGPSIEAGIDPLYSYHTAYSVQDHTTKQFMLGPETDFVLYLLIEDTDGYFKQVSNMYREMLLAKPTKFYHTMKNLVEKGVLLEPFLNNNFDGLCEEVGVKSVFVRDYTKYFRFKDFSFHPEAKSLWVVGSHADRRFLEKLAREKGLKVIYIDPEKFVEDGVERPYPLEGPQDNDIVINMFANQFAQELDELFG